MHSEKSKIYKICHFLPALFVYCIKTTLLIIYTNNFVLQISFKSYFESICVIITYWCALMTIVNHNLSIFKSPGKVIRIWEKNDNEKDEG